MKKFKKYFIFCLGLMLIWQVSVAQGTQDLSRYNGKTIQKIEIQTKRVDPKIVRHKFLLQEGELFEEGRYKRAIENLHNMRIFKKLDFKIDRTPQDNLIIRIKGEDGAYVFPLAFISGGGQKGVGLTLVEGNYLKKGEMIYTFMGFGDDGIMAILGGGYNDYYASFKFENLNFYRRFYEHNWVSMKGIFGSDRDKKHFENPLAEIYQRQDKLSLTLARKRNDFTIFITPEYFYLNSADKFNDGIHSTVTVGANYQRDMRRGTNFGALFGYGLSDKKEALTDLTARKFGYKLTSSLQQGYKWAGNDYKILKLYTEAQTNMEFKNRNLLLFYLKWQNSFGSPFEDKVQTHDLLDFGKHLRQRYGRQGVGTGLSYVWYIVRNKIGLFSLSPFYEFATVYEGRHYYNQSGVGANLSYQFWRFPFPVGLNYTYGLNDHCHQVSFIVGAKFGQ